MASNAPNQNVANAGAFDTLLGGWKTYLTAGIGIIINAVGAFDIYDFTTEQITSINGIVIMAAAIFLRMGIKKAQSSAASAQVSAQGAKQAATMIARQSPVQSAVAANAQSLNAPQVVDPTRFDRT